MDRAGEALLKYVVVNDFDKFPLPEKVTSLSYNRQILLSVDL